MTKLKKNLPFPQKCFSLMKKTKSILKLKVRSLKHYIKNTTLIKEKLNKDIRSLLVITDEKQLEIEKKLHELIRNCDHHKTEKVLNTFIERNREKSARFYALKLWNIRKVCYNTKRKSLKYISKCLKLTKKNDLETIKVIFRNYYPELYYKILCDIQEEHFTELNHSMKNVLIDGFKHVLHIWILNMPLLLELGKYIKWDQLIKHEIALLDFDKLYEILVDLSYKSENLKENCKFQRKLVTK